MKAKNNNKIIIFIIGIMALSIILVFFVFQNIELLNNSKYERNTIEPNINGMGIAEIDKEVKSVDGISSYIVSAAKECFKKYAKYVYEENEEAILEINSKGNTYLKSDKALNYEVKEIYTKAQYYAFTFFVACGVQENEIYYVIDMDTSNKTFKIEEIDKDTFLSAKNGSVSDKYDYKVAIKRGTYNTFKFDNSL